MPTTPDGVAQDIAPAPDKTTTDSLNHVACLNALADWLKAEGMPSAARVARSVASALSGPAAADARYLIWSNEERAWWRPDSRGHTVSTRTAGRYSREEALSICRSGRAGWRRDSAPAEIPVSESDIHAIEQLGPLPEAGR